MSPLPHTRYDNSLFRSFVGCARLISKILKVPHPLVNKLELRVQTDGEITPKDALLGACHDTVKDLGTLSREFTKEFELRKMVGAAQQQNGVQD